MDAAKTFRERLKVLRESKGLLQKDFADKANIPQGEVSHYEQGTRTPTLNKLVKLADALDVSIDYLLGRTGNDNPEISEIIEQYLKHNGYDGLADGNDGCACLLNDLMPCGGDFVMRCRAGFKKEGCDDWCGNGCDFHVVLNKQG